MSVKRVMARLKGRENDAASVADSLSQPYPLADMATPGSKLAKALPERAGVRGEFEVIMIL
jgi:hypothetical protein